MSLGFRCFVILLRARLRLIVLPYGGILLPWNSFSGLIDILARLVGWARGTEHCPKSLIYSRLSLPSWRHPSCVCIHLGLSVAALFHRMLVFCPTGPPELHNDTRIRPTVSECFIKSAPLLIVSTYVGVGPGFDSV